MSGHIYHGPWINFDKGGVIRGATLTLSDRDGGLLTSFIATFVTLTGAQLWKVICFAIHQLRSTTQPRDALFHQQQAVWRNTNGPGGIAWVFLTQSWFCTFSVPCSVYSRRTPSLSNLCLIFTNQHLTQGKARPDYLGSGHFHGRFSLLHM